MVRSQRGEPELTQAEINDLLSRRDAWHEAGTTPERLAHINELATQFYEARFPGSWAHDYLVDRLHTDITGDPGYRPGYAPDSWTSLVNHLRRQGVTDHEMILAGVAKQASTGNLIDRFRNRVVFPITHDGQILGFIARRHPDADDTAGPKYLNTPETPLFHKGAQLYGHAPSLLRGGRPVLVEGPMDAIAVTLATGGEYVGVAALGTALTREQARQLRRYTDVPIVATDNDKAGQAAAERDYWILTDLGHDPLHATLPEGTDPADLVAEPHEPRDRRTRQRVHVHPAQPCHARRTRHQRQLHANRRSTTRSASSLPRAPPAGAAPSTTRLRGQPRRPAYTARVGAGGAPAGLEPATRAGAEVATCRWRLPVLRLRPAIRPGPAAQSHVGPRARKRHRRTLRPLADDLGNEFDLPQPRTRALRRRCTQCRCPHA